MVNQKENKRRIVSFSSLGLQSKFTQDMAKLSMVIILTANYNKYARVLILFLPIFIRYFHTRNMYKLIPLCYEILYYGCLGVIYSTHTHFSKNVKFAYPTKFRTDLTISLG